MLHGAATPALIHHGANPRRRAGILGIALDYSKRPFHRSILFDQHRCAKRASWVCLAGVVTPCLASVECLPESALGLSETTLDGFLVAAILGTFGEAYYFRVPQGIEFQAKPNEQLRVHWSGKLCG